VTVQTLNVIPEAGDGPFADLNLFPHVCFLILYVLCMHVVLM